MNLANLIRTMGEQGATVEQIAQAVEALTQPIPVYEMEQTTRNARQLRNKRYYEKKTAGQELGSSEASESKTFKTLSDAIKTPSDGFKTHSGGLAPEAPSRVVNTKLPSEVVITSEPNGSSVDRSLGTSTPDHPPEKPTPKTRGTRLPDDWEPTPANIEVGRREGLTDEEISRAAREFRNYWTALSGSKSTRLSWDRTWENRVLQVADRYRRDRSRMASAPGKPGAGGRGSSSFADLYARRHGFVAD